MRNVKIVADSSANILELQHTAFAAAPLKVITDTREFPDDAALDVDAMVSWFDSYKGKSKTSCPNPSDWLEAFGDADEVYCVTITSGLSGSYNAACIAKQIRKRYHTFRKRTTIILTAHLAASVILTVKNVLPFGKRGLYCDYYDAIRGIYLCRSLTNPYTPFPRITHPSVPPGPARFCFSALWIASAA